MIRVAIFIVVVFLVAAGFAWLADRPGSVVFTWQDYEVRASLMIAATALLVLIAALAFLGSLLRGLFNTPGMLGRFIGARRRERGYRALSTGMIAVGAGDVRAASRAADEALALLGREPMTLLLTAQAAQLAGDGARARGEFEALAARPDTHILGLHGLFVEARRQGEHEAARHFAEEAARAAPRIGWAGTALFEYQAREGDWLGALRTLAANADQRLVDKVEAKRQRASLLTARALELEAGDPAEARSAALEACRLEPELAPAAVVAARLLTRADDIRRATKVLEAAWRVAPHPEVAEAYATVRPGDSVRDRLKRMRRLSELRPNHPESMAAVARAAIDAHEFAAARAALDPLIRLAPSERICLLMAEIEERENGDQGRVRVWLARALTAPRDPAWIADGRPFERWAPVSPSGRVGAFEWKVPALPPAPRPAVELASEPPPRADRANLPALTSRPNAASDRAVAAIAPAEAQPEAEGEPAIAAGAPAANSGQVIVASVPAVEPGPASGSASGTVAAPEGAASATEAGNSVVANEVHEPADGAMAEPDAAPAAEVDIARLAMAPDDPGPSPPEPVPVRARRFWLF
jgi:HemY protein